MAESNGKAIEIQVFDSGMKGNLSPCDARQSPEERTRAVARALARKHGDKVRVAFIDLFSERGQRMAGVWEEITRRNLSLPVVTMDGRVVMAGELSYAKLGREVERWLGDAHGAVLGTERNRGKGDAQ